VLQHPGGAGVEVDTVPFLFEEPVGFGGDTGGLVVQ